MRLLLVFLLFLSFAVTGILEAAASDSDRCQSLIAESKMATGRLNAYSTRTDATTSEALKLIREVRGATKRAIEACAGSDKEAGLKFSDISMERIESALGNAKTENLHDLGIFPLPVDPNSALQRTRASGPRR
jgi:hypothetical protein